MRVATSASHSPSSRSRVLSTWSKEPRSGRGFFLSTLCCWFPNTRACRCVPRVPAQGWAGRAAANLVGRWLRQSFITCFEESTHVRVFFTLLISAILLGGCAAKQKATSAQAASTQEDRAAGEPPIEPNNIARENYDRAVADYQNCLLDNTANLSACEGQRTAMNAAANLLFGPSSKRNTIIGVER